MNLYGYSMAPNNPKRQKNFFLKFLNLGSGKKEILRVPNEVHKKQESRNGSVSLRLASLKAVA